MFDKAHSYVLYRDTLYHKLDQSSYFHILFDE